MVGNAWNEIEMHSSHNEGKSVVLERFKSSKIIKEP